MLRRDDRHECTHGCFMCSFNHAWEAMARDGMCDDLGSAEYWRVVQAWLRADRQTDVNAFIRFNTEAPRWVPTPPYTQSENA